MDLTKHYWLLKAVIVGLFLPVCVGKLIPCGDKLIDSNKKQCCTGKIEPKFNGKKCCYEAKDFYFSRDSICCGGNILSKYTPSGQTLGCCDNKVITLNDTKCCSNTERILPGGHSGSFGCCGTELINWKEKRCCEHESNLVLSRSYNRQEGTFCCGNKLGKKGHYWCKSEGMSSILLPRNRDRCEGKEIDLLEKSCCAGKINNVPRIDVNRINDVNTDFGCCGTTAYNTTEKKCCQKSGVAIPNLEHLLCLSNGSSYDKRMWMQCNEVLHRKHSSHTKCCGNATYDLYTHGCCDQQIYNIDTEICCGNVGAKPLSKDKICCAGQELMSDHICCDQKKQVLKNDVTDDKCCVNIFSETAASYNSIVKDCINGDLVTKPKDLEICEKMSFSPTEAACCDGNLHYFHKDSSGTYIPSKCCGTELLDNDKVCCPFGITVPKSKNDHDDCCLDTERRGSVQSFNSKHKFCQDGHLHQRHKEKDNCGEMYYTPNTGVCCMDTLHLHPKGAKLECCNPGTAAYDERWQTCCHGNVYNISSNNAECCEGKAFQIDDPSNPCLEMCANRFYDNNIYFCCNNELLLKDMKQDSCCQGRPFSTKDKTCCGGVLYNTPAEKGKCCGRSFIRSKQKNKKCCQNFMTYNKRESVCKSTGITHPKKQLTIDKRFSRSGIKRQDGYPWHWCFATYAYSGNVTKWRQTGRKRIVYKLKDVKRLCRFHRCTGQSIRELTIVLHLDKRQSKKYNFFIPKKSPLAVFFTKALKVKRQKAILHLREKDVGYAFLYRGRLIREMSQITIDHCLSMHSVMDSQIKKVWRINEDMLWFADV